MNFCNDDVTRATEEVILNGCCLTGRRGSCIACHGHFFAFPIGGIVTYFFLMVMMIAMYHQSALKRNEDVYFLGLIHR